MSSITGLGMTSSLSIQYQTHSRISPAVFLADDWKDTTCVHSPATLSACRLLLK